MYMTTKTQNSSQIVIKFHPVFWVKELLKTTIQFFLHLTLAVTPPSPRAGESFVLTITGGNFSAENTVIRVELRNYMGESLEVMNNITGVKQLNVSIASCI